MSTTANARVVRRIYDELIAEGATNYDTGLLPMPFGPEEMKGTVLMVTAAFLTTATRSKRSS